jgi:hypothetical protein
MKEKRFYVLLMLLLTLGFVLVACGTDAAPPPKNRLRPSSMQPMEPPPKSQWMSRWTNPKTSQWTSQKKSQWTSR